VEEGHCFFEHGRGCDPVDGDALDREAEPLKAHSLLGVESLRMRNLFGAKVTLIDVGSLNFLQELPKVHLRVDSEHISI